ncbi:MAG: S8 family peptidase [Thermoanaerobaculia bacterium]
MKLKHVILRQPVVAEAANIGFEPGMEPAAIPAAAPADAVPAPEAVIESDTLTPKKAAEMVASPDNDIIAAAPVIPLKLIEPIADAAAADPLLQGSTWGIKAVGADQSPFTGENIVVAVLDTGIDPNHPAFAGVTLVRKNFTNGPDDDVHGHGTHCAGTIFGRDVNGTRIGIARGVTKAVIGKVLGPGGGGSDVLLDAIMWAIGEGANVISMSLGIDFPGFVASLQNDQHLPPELATSIALEGYRANVLLFERLAALIEARTLNTGKPCIVVAAAGNESQRAVDPDFEIAVSPPAVSDGIISVAAFGNDNPQGFTIATFSNTGAILGGPGVGVLSARRGGGLQTMSGTSMATPHVAGVAALWADKMTKANQFRSPQFKNRLLGSPTLDGFVAGFDSQDAGDGMVQAPNILSTDGIARTRMIVFARCQPNEREEQRSRC